MGNYRNLEIDFIERTLELISQYEKLKYKFKFENQYNHTLLINCLLGLIVFPKEKAISYLPKETLINQLKKDMGFENTIINENITDLKSLIISLRHSIAHFDIHFHSEDENYLINRIIFKDREQSDDYVIASFIPSELLSFIRYNANWFLLIFKKYKNKIFETA